MGDFIDKLLIGIIALAGWYLYGIFKESGQSTSKKVWDDAIQDADTRFKADEASGTLAPVTKCPSDPNLLAGDSRCTSPDTYYQSPNGFVEPTTGMGTTVWGYDAVFDSYLPASVPPPKVHGELLDIATELQDEIEMYNYLQGLI